MLVFLVTVQYKDEFKTAATNFHLVSRRSESRFYKWIGYVKELYTDFMK